MTCRFFALGDWGRRGVAAQCAVARAMTERARERPLTAVLSTGDNFYENGVTGLADAHWTESFDAVYDAPELQVPWIIALGNHDHGGNVDALMHRTRLCDRWLLPERWYTGRLPLDPAQPDGAEVELIVLDTSVFLARHRPDGREPIAGLADSEDLVFEQLAWLDGLLAAPPPAWRVVVGHHPLYSAGSLHGSNLELQDFLGERLEEGGVDLYLAGHEHDLQHGEADGIDHIVSGAGSIVRETGREWFTRFSDAVPGFVELEFDPARMRARFLGVGHGVLHEFERAARTSGELQRA